MEHKAMLLSYYLIIRETFIVLFIDYRCQKKSLHLHKVSYANIMLYIQNHTNHPNQES